MCKRIKLNQTIRMLCINILAASKNTRSLNLMFDFFMVRNLLNMWCVIFRQTWHNWTDPNSIRVNCTRRISTFFFPFYRRTSSVKLDVIRMRSRKRNGSKNGFKWENMQHDTHIYLRSAYIYKIATLRVPVIHIYPPKGDMQIKGTPNWGPQCLNQFSRTKSPWLHSNLNSYNIWQRFLAYSR